MHWNVKHLKTQEARAEPSPFFQLDLRFDKQMYDSQNDTSVPVSVIGQCQTSAILLNNQNAEFNNGLTIDMLSLIMD